MKILIPIIKTTFSIILIFILFISHSLSDENEFTKTLKEAELGDPISQNNVAHMYDNGLGTEKNLLKCTFLLHLKNQVFTSFGVVKEADATMLEKLRLLEID